jgi:hypothetical protein
MIAKGLAESLESAREVARRKSVWMVEYLRGRRQREGWRARLARRRHFLERRGGG